MTEFRKNITNLVTTLKGLDFLHRDDLKTSWSISPSDDNIPSEKLVKDTIDALTLDSSGGFDFIRSSTLDRGTIVATSSLSEISNGTRILLMLPSSLPSGMPSSYPISLDLTLSDGTLLQFSTLTYYPRNYNGSTTFTSNQLMPSSMLDLVFVEVNGYLDGFLRDGFYDSNLVDTARLNNYVLKSNVKDNLTSTDTDKPLSANQGKVLKGLIDNVDSTGKEDISNKVASISSNSTDTQYPSAKCLYDIVTLNDAGGEDVVEATIIDGEYVSMIGSFVLNATVNREELSPDETDFDIFIDATQNTGNSQYSRVLLRLFDENTNSSFLEQNIYYSDGSLVPLSALTGFVYLHFNANHGVFIVKEGLLKETIMPLIPTRLSQLSNDGNYMTYNSVVDNLTTPNPSAPLSAKQGKVLNEKIGEITTFFNGGS